MRELNTAEANRVNGGVLLLIGAVLVADAFLIGMMHGMKHEFADGANQ